MEMTLRGTHQRLGFTTLIVAFIGIHHVWGLVDRHLCTKSSCQWSYRINDLLRVTMHDLGSDCPDSVVESASDRSIYERSVYQVRIHPETTGRAVEVIWDYFGCYTDIYMQFTVSFQPYYMIDSSRKKCIRFNVKHIDEKRVDDIVRLYFNCLQINSKEVGVLSINSYRNISAENLCPSFRPAYPHSTFDLGCGYDFTEVFIVRCLTLELRGLHPQTDYEKIIVVLQEPNGCNRTLTGSKLFLSRNPAIIELPVPGNGTYHVEVKLLCNASGEVHEKTFNLTATIADHSSCIIKKQAVPTDCQQSTSPILVTTDTSPLTGSSPPESPQNQLYTVLAVVGVIGTAVLVVIVVHTRRNQPTSNSRKDANTRQEDSNQPQRQCECGENECHNNNCANASETSELTLEDTKP